jgi:phage gp36-like protein
MAFIAETDLYRAMRSEYIAEIKRTDDALPDHCISAAISEMKTYLRETFDTEAIFSATDTDRDSLLVTFCVDIAIYNLIELVPVGVDVEQKRLRYKRAIDWLKGVQKSEIKPDLPILENSPAQAAIIYGSVERKEMRY